ncbi:MAG TPA: sigma-70 family RNA polymerase sigma factor [Thermoanaerobaculia bacterium]|nr:sigma-70 family RNA polymerase sigma factor [Thermoanaerobaculia bacterium]
MLEPVAEGSPRITRLQQVIRVLGLKPVRVIREADRLAQVMNRPSVSRQHFLRIRIGRAAASEEKIFIIVAAMRSLTGLLFRPADLFDVEPEAGFDGSLPAAPVFSDSRSRVWRVLVPQESGSSEDPLESLYTEYGLLLRGIAMRRYRVPPDDAEALVHDVFVAYLQRRIYIRDVKGWLAGAVGNASKNYLRKRKPEAALLPEHDEAIDIGAEQRLEQWMRRSAAASVLARLGERCRETLRRYYLREETKERIAEHLETSPGNVLQLLVACRRRAQEILHHLSRKKP